MVTKELPINRTVVSCMNNATRIIPYENGFLSIIESTAGLSTQSLYQYIQSAPFSSAECNELFSVEDYKFITTMKSPPSVTTTYILFNSQVIIKPSYSTNFQTYSTDSLGYELFSYALTSEYLYLLYVPIKINDNLCNQDDQTMILIYSLD